MTRAAGLSRLPTSQAATTDPPPLCALNIGCGARFHPAWINLDLAPQHPSILQHDVTLPLPFPAEGFDAVYHAHVLEHLPRERARFCLSECARVLRPGGILRVVVPDLEQIARLYL